MKPISATMATVATMIVTPDDHRRAAAVRMVTVGPGPQITVAIVATVAAGVQRAAGPLCGVQGRSIPCDGTRREAVGARTVPCAGKGQPALWDPVEVMVRHFILGIVRRKNYPVLRLCEAGNQD